MKHRLAWILTLAAIALLSGGVIWFSRSGPARKSEARAPVLQPELIRTASPRRLDFQLVRPCFGRAESWQVVKIVALQAGRIVAIESRPETLVKKGAHLFRLGGPRVSSRLAVLRTKAASLKQRLALARATVALQEEALRQRLVKRVELAAAKDALAKIRSQLQAAREELRCFQEAIRVRAPIEGFFTGRQVSVGQEVSKGTLLAEIVALNKMRVAAELFPSEGASLVGCKAVLVARQGVRIPGIVTRVLPQRTPAGATVVWIEGAGLERYFKPGETVSGEVVISVHHRALAVPRNAIVRDEKERPYVFVREPRGYHKKAVQTGLASGGWIEVTSGVKEADQVVTQGAYELLYRNFNKVYKARD